ncbi:hypothetical protein M9Y10_025688 [Tritrichomonas musculus]|uniref:Alpha-L-rhamnosidase six-hairpin glycosidase domain-containing protein n=1 Tax=Tritrichomonas musculus TaxID=1915356 RepID=A0ABR2HBA0_9EUKA
MRRCGVQTQTALSLANIHDLHPEGTMETSLGSLNKLIQDKNYHICTGFIGSQIICRALTKAGGNKTASLVFLQKSYSGWLYPVTMKIFATRWKSGS